MYVAIFPWKINHETLYYINFGMLSQPLQLVKSNDVSEYNFLEGVGKFQVPPLPPSPPHLSVKPGCVFIFHLDKLLRMYWYI